MRGYTFLEKIEESENEEEINTEDNITKDPAGKKLRPACFCNSALIQLYQFTVLIKRKVHMSASDR